MNGIVFLNVSALDVIPYLVGAAFIVGWFLARREARARSDFRFGRRHPYARWCIGFPAVLGLLLLALANPARIRSDLLEESIEGRILILMDHSRSMQVGRLSPNDADAQDIPRPAWDELITKGYKNPTRLALCQETLIEAFGSLRGADIALLPYSGSTKIRAAWMSLRGGEASKLRLEGLFRSVQVQWLGSGTNIDRVFHDALEFFGRDPDIAILCSDSGGGGDEKIGGREFFKSVKDFAWQAEAPKKHIPIYVLGVGGGSPSLSHGERIVRKAPIPIYDDEGNLAGFNRHTDGQLIEPEFTEEPLIWIAEFSEGAYRRVERLSDGRALLRTALLTSLSKGEVKIRNPENQAGPLVATAFLLSLFVFGGFAWLRAMFTRRKQSDHPEA